MSKLQDLGILQAKFKVNTKKKINNDLDFLSYVKHYSKVTDFSDFQDLIYVAKFIYSQKDVLVYELFLDLLITRNNSNELINYIFVLLNTQLSLFKIKSQSQKNDYDKNICFAIIDKIEQMGLTEKEKENYFDKIKDTFQSIFVIDDICLLMRFYNKISCKQFYPKLILSGILINGSIKCFEALYDWFEHIIQNFDTNEVITCIENSLKTQNELLILSMLNVNRNEYISYLRKNQMLTFKLKAIKDFVQWKIDFRQNPLSDFNKLKQKWYSVSIQ